MSFKKRFQELLADKSLSENELCATIDALLKDGIDPAVLLYMAVESDHLPAVKHLRELGADPASIVTDGKNPVSLAIDLDKWEIVEYFLSKDFNRSLIFAGIETLSPLMIDYLESKYVKVPHELKNSEDLDWVNQIN